MTATKAIQFHTGSPEQTADGLQWPQVPGVQHMLSLSQQHSSAYSCAAFLSPIRCFSSESATPTASRRNFSFPFLARPRNSSSSSSAVQHAKAIGRRDLVMRRFRKTDNSLFTLHSLSRFTDRRESGWNEENGVFQFCSCRSLFLSLTIYPLLLSLSLLIFRHQSSYFCISFRCRISFNFFLSNHITPLAQSGGRYKKLIRKSTFRQNPMSAHASYSTWLC